MADSDDDGLMLNLGEGFESTVATTVKKKKKGQASKWQKNRRSIQSQELKIKKKEFKQSPNEFHHEFDKDKGRTENRNGPSKRDPVDIPKKDCRVFTEKPKEFFSSLFTCNPEIPDVPKGTSVGTKDYDLFSEKPVNETEISDRLMKALKDRFGFKKFTKVQKEAIPAFLSGSDVLIKSPTGSGKTLSYALPLIHRLQQMMPRIQRTDGPYAVVLLPTRELALQSYEVFESLCRTCVWIVPGLIVGGEKRKAEKSRIRKGINIVVATPGRLLDHLATTKSLSLKNLLVLVFDEADRLLDMGFEQTISRILSFIKEQCNRKIQTALLSATLSSKIENLASISLENKKLIDTTETDITTDSKADESKNSESSVDYLKATQNEADFEKESFFVPNTLKQYFVIVPAKLRLVSLIACLLKFGFRSENGKVIVFFSSKSSTELHSQLLVSEPVQELASPESCEIYKLHGDMKPDERNSIFHKFKQCNKGILLCTDVAARGLDLPHVSWIIQYSCPTQIQDYVHRVGRTARIGEQGEALLFLLPSEVKYITALEEENIEMQKLGLFDVLKYLNATSGKKFNQSLIQSSASDIQNKLEGLVTERSEFKTVAESAFRSYIQAYATYPATLKEFFHVKRLHLGHIAKSFALRTAPQQMQRINAAQVPSAKKKEIERIKGKKRKAADMSESGGGVVINGPRPGGKKTKKKK